MLLSMAMMVTTPPSCLRPPPDPPPSSCVNVPLEGLSPVIPPEPPDPPDVTLLPMLLSSHRSSAHHVPFRAGFHHAVAVSSTLPLVAVASPLGVKNAGASQLEGGLTGSGRSHLFDYMHRQPDLIPAKPPPPRPVTTGRETSSPLRSRASPMQSPQEALPSENPDSSSFIQSLFESDDWQFGICSAKPSWFLHGNAGTRSSCLNSLLIVALELLVKPQYIFNAVDIIIYLLLDSHSPPILVNAKSSQLGLCFLYGHGAFHQKLLSVIIPTVAYSCINVVFDYQFALGKKMKFLHETLYTAELDSPLKSSIFQCFVMLFSIIPSSSMAPGSSSLIVNFVAL
ncbi:hypothetical protein HID58_004473 [Brassica napus]|uniref:Uncharacterized protein n=1 Tax=Brassica napus TaxID=3708 RepID=A0ABQ8E6H9_BRANA|nr:hypothetical protein HID58_004473 [Brassica napus]